jgi:uncharacterized membrane protein YesL
MEKQMSAFNQIMSVFTSFVLLNFLWVLFCLPVVTIFPATAALFGTVRKWIKVGFDVGILKVFVQEFKDNFKKSFSLGFLWIVGFLILYMDISIVLQNEFTGKSLLLILLLFFTLLFAFVSIYLFFILVNYELTILHTVKNSLLLSLSHMNYTVLFLGMILAVFIVIYYFPFFLLVSGSLLAFTMYGMFHKLLSKLDEGKKRPHKMNLDITQEV